MMAHHTSKPLATLAVLAVGALSLGALTLVGGCRGWTSADPPVHLNPNMDSQPKLKPYRHSEFFSDGRAMQTPPEGTVPRTVAGNGERDADFQHLDDHMYTGVVDGQVVNTPPPGLVIDEKLLQRGRERYDIFCAPCHARHGDGTGLVSARLNIKPPTLHDDIRYKKPLGHFYRVITHGKPLPEEGSTVSNMWSYAAQIPVKDRWAIALYIRALQRTTAKGALPAADVQRLDGAAAPAAAPPTDGEVAPATDGDAAPATEAAAPAAAAAPAEPAKKEGGTP